MADIDSLWDFNAPDASEARFRDALEGERDAATRCELMTQIARALGLQRRFDDAHAVLDEALQGVDGDSRLMVRYLLERGRACHSGGDPRQARPLFEEAWERAREAGEDALAVDAAHMVAIVESGESQMEWNRKALELALASPDPRARRWRASLANNMGWTLHELGRHEEALSQFREAEQARVEMGDARTLAIARWCVARCLRSLGRLEEALEIQTELVESDGDGFAFEEMAECLHALGRQEEASPWFAKAAAKLSVVFEGDESQDDRLSRLEELGRAVDP